VFITPNADCAEARPFHCDKRLGSDDGERGVTAGRHGDGVADLLFREAKQSTCGGAVREGELCRVVEATRHKVAVVYEARLYGVCQRHTEHQIAPAAARVVGRCQRHAKVVRRMAGLGRGQEVVHEIDVSHQGGVPERRVHRIGVAAADQGTWPGGTEVRDLLPALLDGGRPQGGDAAPERVKDVDR
jgi:hypothetical protein